MNSKTVIIFFVILKSVAGQLSVSNMFEYQVGNLPQEIPSNLTTHYDQLNIAYRLCGQDHRIFRDILAAQLIPPVSCYPVRF